jgi:hypothetical protein
MKHYQSVCRAREVILPCVDVDVDDQHVSTSALWSLTAPWDATCERMCTQCVLHQVTHVKNLNKQNSYHRSWPPQYRDIQHFHLSDLKIDHLKTLEPSNLISVHPALSAREDKVLGCQRSFSDFLFCLRVCHVLVVCNTTAPKRFLDFYTRSTMVTIFYLLSGCS